MSRSSFFAIPDPDSGSVGQHGSVPGGGPSPFERLTRRVALAAASGAAGGLCGFLCGEAEAGVGDTSRVGGAPMMLTPAVWMAVVGTIMGLCILAAANVTGIGGKWYRNLGIAVPILMVGCGISGGLAQLVYGTMRLIFGLAFGESLLQIVLIRALGWAIMGMGVGAFLGIARFNRKQVFQGALGGCLGGYLGGLSFDALALINHDNNGAFSRCFGLILTGACIAAGMCLVQQLFNSAWLLGVSTGPYEGKEYCLDTPAVTVGRSQSNQIALFRDESLPERLGTLVNRGGHWRWEGSPIVIDGVAQTNAEVSSGSRLEFGRYTFKFSDRSLKAPSQAPSVPMPIVPSAGPAVPFKPVVPAPAPYIAAPPHPAPPAPVTAPQPRSGAGDAPASARPGIGPTSSAERLVLRPVTGNWPRFALGRAASAALGRTEENDWCLPDEAVSSRHAFFMSRDGRLTVTDLDSTNGTLVNGERLAPRVPVPVRAGDRIRFGEVEYVVEGE